MDSRHSVSHSVSERVDRVAGSLPPATATIATPVDKLSKVDYGIITTYISFTRYVHLYTDFYSLSQHCSYKTLFTKEVVPNDLRAETESTHTWYIALIRNRYKHSPSADGEFIGRKKLVITAYCWLPD